MTGLNKAMNLTLDEARTLILYTPPRQLDTRPKRTVLSTGESSPSVVTDLDLQVQRLVIARMRGYLGDDFGILAEEDGHHTRAGLRNRNLLILDPIDGTAPMVQGSWMCAVCLAVVIDGQITGCVDLPRWGLRFDAPDGVFHCNALPRRLPSPPRSHLTVAVKPRHADRLPAYLHDRRSVLPLPVPGAGVAAMLAMLATGLAQAMLIWPPATYPGSAPFDILPMSALMPPLGIQVRSLEPNLDLTNLDVVLGTQDPPRHTGGIIAGTPEAIRDLRAVLTREPPRID